MPLPQHRREALAAVAPLPIAIAPTVALLGGVRPGDGWWLAALPLVSWVVSVAGLVWVRPAWKAEEEPGPQEELDSS